VLGLLLAGILAAGGYDGGTTLCTLQDRRIPESSGVVTSSTDDDVLYTHNDSGDVARFFAIDRQCHTLATFVLPGVQARDWEDISRGPGQTIWLGDIGDNSATRDRGILVHRVAEPDASARGTVRVESVSYRLRYPDGPHDAEALLVHPRTGQLLVVTKAFSGGRVYAATLPLRTDGPNVLRLVGSLPIPEITGGDISPDGTRVVLRNYTAAYEWDISGDDVVAALRTEWVRVPLPPAPQGEGISYTRDGHALVVTSEGLGAPVQELRRLPVPKPTVASAPTVTSARRGSLRGVVLACALGVLLLGLVGLAVTRGHRR
jgi:hypothetical protein